MALLDLSRPRKGDLPVLHPPVKPSEKMAKVFSFLEESGGIVPNDYVSRGISPMWMMRARPSRAWLIVLAVALAVVVLLVSGFYYGSHAR